jgi:hypothetical protein
VNEEIIRRNSKRYLDRYQFGAEWIPVEPDFKTGFGVEIGDSIVFGEPALQVSDTSTGTRDFRPRVFEVVNKDFDWRAGRVRLQIVDTNYSTGVRYGTWAPASNIVEKVNSTQIKLTPSFGSESEAEKWAPYLNRTVRIRSEDFSSSQNVRLVSFDPADPLIATVSPAITDPSLTGFVLDVPNYDDLNLTNDALYKALHPFWNCSAEVSATVDDVSFEVSAGDLPKFFVGATVRVFAPDYSQDSKLIQLRVKEISGSTIVLNSSMGFFPLPGYRVELIGFASDQGTPYVWV